MAFKRLQATRLSRLLTLLLTFLLVATSSLGLAGRQPGSAEARTDAADVILYDDALAAGWQNWSWDTTVDFGNVNPVHGGTASIAVTYNAAYAGFSLRTPEPLDGAGYSAISFWAHGGAQARDLSLYTQATDDGGGSDTYEFTVPAGGWTQFTIPLSALGSPATIARVNIQENAAAAGVTFYLDDLRLVGKTAGASPTPTRTATATRQPSPTTTRAPGGSKWDLWQGATQLRGANIYQRLAHPEADGEEVIQEYGPIIPPYTQRDLDRLAEFGANYVNISHPGLFTEEPPYQLDQRVQDNLDSFLAMIAETGMVAVISFRTGPGRNEWTFLDEESPGWVGRSLNNNAMWGDEAAQDAWVAMWRYTAQRYRDNPIVAGYDLLVEPNSNAFPPVNIWDPEQFYSSKYAGSTYDWNELHPRLSGAIREVDPNTPILTGAMGYSAVAWLPYLQPTGDPRTVYTIHQYAPFDYTHQDPPLDLSYPDTFDTDGDGDSERFDRAWLDALLATVDSFKATHGVPVASNEFGAKRWQPGVAQFMTDQMDLYEARGMNHAVWAWQPSTEPFAGYSHDFNMLFGPNPNNRKEVATSDLIEAVKRNWARNLEVVPTPSPTATGGPPSTPSATGTRAATTTPGSGTPTPTGTTVPGATRTPTGTAPAGQPRLFLPLLKR